MALEGGSQFRTILARVREEYAYGPDDPYDDPYDVARSEEMKGFAYRAYEALEAPDQTYYDARRELADIARDPACGTIDIYLAACAWDDLSILLAAALLEPGVPARRRRQLVAIATNRHGILSLWMPPAPYPRVVPQDDPHGHPTALERYESGCFPDVYYLSCRLPVVGSVEARRDLKTTRWRSYYRCGRALASAVAGFLLGMAERGTLEASVAERWTRRALRRIRDHLAWAARARAAAALLGRRGEAAAAYACRG